MNDDFEALEVYEVLDDNSLIGHLAMIKKALAAGVNPHAKITIARIDVNGIYVYNNQYVTNIDPEQQIVFLECED